MDLMRRDGAIATGFRGPRLAGPLGLALAVSLLLGTVDLHSLVHHRQNLTAAAHDAAHPGPVHLDTARGAKDLPCLACLAGLRSQDRSAAAPRGGAPPEPRGGLAADRSPGAAALLAYRLPLSRAPPLS